MLHDASGKLNSFGALQEQTAKKTPKASPAGTRNSKRSGFRRCMRSKSSCDTTLPGRASSLTEERCRTLRYLRPADVRATTQWPIMHVPLFCHPDDVLHSVDFYNAGAHRAQPLVRLGFLPRSKQTRIGPNPTPPPPPPRPVGPPPIPWRSCKPMLWRVPLVGRPPHPPPPPHHPPPPPPPPGARKRLQLSCSLQTSTSCGHYTASRHYNYNPNGPCTPRARRPRRGKQPPAAAGSKAKL